MLLHRPTCYFQLLLLLLFGFCSENSIAQEAVERDRRPNIVLINLDDADAELLSETMLSRFYPNMHALARRGTRFSNMHATTPFCAPSRAALFRGQYASQTGVKVNDPTNIGSNGFTGGYGEFLARGHDQAELGVWLKNAGYRTMHVGKYHHHDFDNVVPPGWDDFRVTLGARYFGTFRFTNQFNEDGSHYQTEEDQYITVVEGNDAVELIDGQADSEQPFFLYVAPIAPHVTSSFVPEDKVEPRYANFADGLSLPRTADLFEADVSDKPRHLRFQLNDVLKNYAEDEYISRVRAIKSVDDMVGRIETALKDAGKFENTVVFLTSDNGFLLGHHNLFNKTDPYQRTSNVPLIVAGPNIGSGSFSHLLAHIDICPTILQLAEAGVPTSVSAKSFLPLLYEPEAFDEEAWQQGILLENWSKKFHFGFSVVGGYVAYRMHHEIFVSWANGQFEYYDLETDPLQINNRYRELTTSEKQGFKRTVRRFRTDDMLPITTIDQFYDEAMQNRNVRLRGYAEDDAGVVRTVVTMRSFMTKRFWNGNSWQDDWFGHRVTMRNRNQPLTQWAFDTRVQTETESGFDYLLFTYRSQDAAGVWPDEVGFHLNPIDSKEPVARFANYSRSRPRFGSRFVLQGSHFDAVGMDRSILTIRNTATNQYFDGRNFVNGRVDLDVDHDDETWSRNVTLPTGRYIAGIRAIDSAGNRQHPAQLLRFNVVTSGVDAELVAENLVLDDP